MADVVAGIIVEYYLIRARADYDGLLRGLVIRRHIAIEFLLGTYHLCAKQSFTCYVCRGVDILVVVGRIDIANRVRIFYPIIVHVQLKAFCRKLAAGIALFRIIGKSGYSQRSSRIGLAYLTVQVRAALILCIALARYVLYPMHYLHGRVKLILGIPERNHVFGFVCAEHKALLVSIGRVAAYLHELLRNYSVAGFSSLFLIQHLLRTLIKIPYGVVDLLLCHIHERKFVIAIDIHGQGVAAGMGEVAALIIFVQFVSGFGFECQGGARKRAAGGLVCYHSSTIFFKHILDSISDQRIAAPLGVKVQILYNGHGEVERLFNAVFFIEPANEYIFAFAVLGVSGLGGKVTVRNCLAAQRGAAHRILVKERPYRVGLGRPFGVDGYARRRHLCIPVHRLYAFGILIPTRKLECIRLKVGRITRCKAFTVGSAKSGFKLYLARFDFRIVAYEHKVVAVALIVELSATPWICNISIVVDVIWGRQFIVISIKTVIVSKAFHRIEVLRTYIKTILVVCIYSMFQYILAVQTLGIIICRLCGIACILTIVSPVLCGHYLQKRCPRILTIFIPAPLAALRRSIHSQKFSAYIRVPFGGNGTGFLICCANMPVSNYRTIIILEREGKLLAVIVYIQHGRTICGNSGLFDTFKLPQFRSHVQICAGRYCGQR